MLCKRQWRQELRRTNRVQREAFLRLCFSAWKEREAVDEVGCVYTAPVADTRMLLAAPDRLIASALFHFCQLGAKVAAANPPNSTS